jgi:hypothetical protein
MAFRGVTLNIQLPSKSDVRLAQARRWPNGPGHCLLTRPIDRAYGIDGNGNLLLTGAPVQVRHSHQDDQVGTFIGVALEQGAPIALVDVPGWRFSVEADIRRLCPPHEWLMYWRGNNGSYGA